MAVFAVAVSALQQKALISCLDVTQRQNPAALTGRVLA
jgi:hypothetical protein